MRSVFTDQEEVALVLKSKSCQCDACVRDGIHKSDCSVHNAPAYPVGECDCGLIDKTNKAGAGRQGEAGDMNHKDLEILYWNDYLKSSRIKLNCLKRDMKRVKKIIKKLRTLKRKGKK